MPLDRFQKVIQERNGDREALRQLQQDHDQVLTYMHQKIVPMVESQNSASAQADDSLDYEDPLERQIAEQKEQLTSMRRELETDRSNRFQRDFTGKVESAVSKYDLASPAEVVDAYLRDNKVNLEDAAKQSHERNLRKADMLFKKRGEVAKAKNLQSATPAALVAKEKPKNMADARKLARDYFRNINS